MKLTISRDGVVKGPDGQIYAWVVRPQRDRFETVLNPSKHSVQRAWMLVTSMLDAWEPSMPLKMLAFDDKFDGSPTSPAGLAMIATELKRIFGIVDGVTVEGESE